MTTWNYRIVRTMHQVGDEQHESFTIRECYYDDTGKITSWTAEPCCPAGDTWQECAQDLVTMLRAAGSPVVDVSSGEAVEIPG